MTTLHILHRLEQGRLPGALQRSLGPDDALLLCGDGVYAALSARHELPPQCHALHDDVRARGLLPQWPADVRLVDHGAFVDLCVLHACSLSWG
ncbi:MAG: tusB [Moraxellaceae bacterium]|jgi:sulfur relay protein TusB/DsrH|nr:tusB [Moraxellaceae bacterium]